MEDWVCYDGPYGGRIIIPSFDMSGQPNYFIARTYVGHGMKYKNPCKYPRTSFLMSYLPIGTEI